MSYIDALFDRQKDRIYIVERNNGVREYTEYPANYTFYHDDPKGKHKTIYGTPVSRFSTHIGKEFHKEVKINSGSGKKIWESDKIKTQNILNEGYNVLRYWASDLKSITHEKIFEDIVHTSMKVEE